MGSLFGLWLSLLFVVPSCYCCLVFSFATLETRPAASCMLNNASPLTHTQPAAVLLMAYLLNGLS